MNQQVKEFLGAVAPTVAAALGGPLAGAAVSSLGLIFGLGASPSIAAVEKLVSDGRIPPDAIAELQKLELQYQNDERERGFKYAELAFRDRDSARNANVSGGVQKELLLLSTFLLAVCIGTEIMILVNGYPPGIPEIIVGRILGLLDSVALLILGYHYGSSSSSNLKTELLSKFGK